MKVIALCLFAATFIQAATANCNSVSTWRAYTDNSTWLSAREKCETAGGQLASIESAQEQRDILVYLLTTTDLTEDQREGDFWIGRNDLDSEGQFVNANGSASNGHNWCPGEPNDGETNGQDCGQFVMDGRCVDDDYCIKENYYLCSFGIPVVTWKAYTVAVSYFDGKELCESEGGRLATIESAETEIAIQRYIKTTSDLTEVEKTYRFYLGRNDMDTEGQWINNNGSASNNYGWCVGEPNGNPGNEQDCSVYAMDWLCIDDVQCEGLRYPLCAFEAILTE